ncbi:thiaminase II [Nocardioides caldifontis]|uniref:thiaminase II n=1 Tax=Nocardioides caldifontis TaxID=2588938 RepID=UPI001396B582|nr:thiaminase II [Nocardioides caldifontis]
MQSFSDQARGAAAEVWDRLPEHPFVRGMADGSLPPSTYQFYVGQNLLYLPQYARAIALGVAKSRDDEELRRYSAALANIVDVEIPQNRSLLTRVQQLSGDLTQEEVMAPATRNYTSYLLSTAATHDVVAIGAVILPCAWSYGEIARHHVDQVVAHPVYRPWFEFFATDEYAALVAAMRTRLDADAAGLAEVDRARLTRVFVDATRLEHDFWDMAIAGKPS